MRFNVGLCGWSSSVLYDERTLGSGEGGDIPGFSTNVVDDGCLEPWNLNDC